ncbi:MAG: sugar phosphate isomerase/epimerase [Deltaproteobacteria bacterium]|nr:sugar phosphate isomerase/epimerase [Deltaproteobacteria bacterium]
MKFAVSTTAFRGRPIEDIVCLAGEAGLHLEFSSGLPYRPDMEEIFYEATCPRIPHNYFPAPRVPFVLNLASLREEIRERSIEHCKKALRMAAMAGAPFYSAHAGFCVDPAPADLGQKLPLQNERPREEYWRRFVEAVKFLAEEARRLNIKFLVENNVVAPMNVSPSGQHPLLCASFDEMGRLMKAVKNPALGVLLDTGHLKVSSLTLGFRPEVFLGALREHVHGIHHSDNDGSEDTNHPITDKYWFLPYTPHYKGAYHILEVHDQTIAQIREQYRLLEKAAKGPNR